MGDLATTNWSLVTTAPNVEFKVAERLFRIEVECLLIKRQIERIFHGKRIVRLAAAFPRYVFVCVHDAWEKVLNINGVIDFVRIGSLPALVSDEVISQLRTRLNSDGILPIIEKSKFKFGQRVMITGNSIHAGRDAVFQYALPNVRACVLQQWFDALRNVEVDEADLIGMDEYRTARNRSRRLRRKIKRNISSHLAA